MNKLHPEITCPFCRIQFGGYKILKDKNKKTSVIHLDVMWSYESGLSMDCEQTEYVIDNILTIDKMGNPTFKEEFKKKIEELKEKFYTCPDDIDKTTFDYNAYYVAFAECLNYGEVEGENEEYDREKITNEKIKQLYDSGVNLYDALRTFIKK